MKGKNGLPPKVAAQREAVVERILEDMEEGGLLWSSPWMRVAKPRNPLSGTVYRGGNRLNLSVIARMKGYDDPRWVTFLQAKKAGWKLPKDQKHAAVVERWDVVKIRGDEEDPEEGEDEGRRCSVPRCIGSWPVFNAAQFEGAPPLELREVPDDELVRMADRFVGSSRCAVVELLSDEACYRPRADRVEMPLRAQFHSTAGFLSTLWHEMGHSTGHPDALDRPVRNRFGSEEYAYEELVAELCSVFVAADVGVEALAEAETAHYRNHLAYLDSWTRALQDEPAILFKAASAADKAARYLVERYEESGSETG